MKQQSVVFTPLRVVLIGFIVVISLAAIASIMLPQQPWADMLGLFAVIFIMMFLFVILLEWTWLYHRGKVQTDPVIQKQYKIAKSIYLVLFVIGVLIGVIYLM